MDLFYFKSSQGNFGDDLNSWIWDRLLPGYRDWGETRVLVGVGTLLNSDTIMGLHARGVQPLVVGSGVGYGDGSVPRREETVHWDVRAVRAPVTAKSLGLCSRIPMLDPAALIADLDGAIPRIAHGEIVFVPHVASDFRHDWASCLAPFGLRYISPSGPSKRVIAEIAGARLVVAESLHAAILADAFRVPWIPVRIGWQFHQGKWRDWAESVGLNLGEVPPLFPGIDRAFAAARYVRQGLLVREPGAVMTPGRTRRLRPGRAMQARLALERMALPSAFVRALARRPLLSSRELLDARKEALWAGLHEIRADYGQVRRRRRRSASPRRQLAGV